MRIRLLGSIIALALTACGGGDDVDGGDRVSPQDQVADMMIDALDAERSAEGVDDMAVDEACIRTVTARLSDDDAEAIVEAGPDGDPDVSITPAELATAFLDCVQFDR